MKRRSRVARPDSFAPMKLLTRGRARLALYRRMFSRISAGRESRVFRWRVFRVAMTEDSDFLVLGALNGGCCSHSAWGRLVAGVLRLPLTWTLVSSIKRPRRRRRETLAAAQSNMGSICKSEPSDMNSSNGWDRWKDGLGILFWGGGRQAIYGGDSLPSRLDYRQLLVLLR